MALFFKKKKKGSPPELPPPPEPPSEDVRKLGDLPAIKPGMPSLPEEVPAPEMPPAPEYAPNEIPAPELPEIPPPEEMPSRVPFPEIPEETAPIAEMPEYPAPVEEKPERIRKPLGALFVAMDEYQKILDDSNKVRAKLMEAEEFVQHLKELKDEEEKTFARWRSHLEDVERKLTKIDRLLAKAK